jgi:hypothetical protein
MIDDGHRVRPSYSILEDINLTSPVDLLKANLKLAPDMPDQTIGANVSLAPGVSVENSVLGANVTVRHPISIKNSLVLEGSTIDSASDIEHCVVSPLRIVDCKLGSEQARKVP